MTETENGKFDHLHRTASAIAKEPKQQISIKLSSSVIEYFKNLSTETGVPYQTLINLYLSDCVRNRRMPNLTWD